MFKDRKKLHLTDEDVEYLSHYATSKDLRVIKKKEKREGKRSTRIRNNE